MPFSPATGKETDGRSSKERRMDKAAPEAELTDRERSVIIFGILTAMLLAALDQSIVTPAMPTIGAALGDAHYLPWIVTAYLLTATRCAALRQDFRYLWPALDAL